MTLFITWALMLVVVVASDNMEKVLSGTNEVLEVAGTLVAIAQVTVE